MNDKYTLRSYVVGMCTLMMLFVAHTTLIAQTPSSVFVQSIDWSADGTRIAISSREALTIYDMAFNPLVSLPFPNDVNFDLHSAIFSPDGTRLLMGNQILDSTTLQTVLTIVDYILPYSGQWSPDGTEIAFSGADDRELRIYSTFDGQLLRTFSSNEWAAGAEFGPYWSPDGRYFATRAGRDAIYIMDARQGTQIARYEFSYSDILPAIWSPDSSRIALQTNTLVPVSTSGITTLTSRYSMIVFEVSTGRTLAEIPGYGERMMWSPDGKEIAAIQNGAVSLWDASTGAQISSYTFSSYGTRTMEYSPYGGQILIGHFSTRPLSEPSVVDASNRSAAIQRTGIGGLVTILVPVSSPSRLATITAACGLPARTEATLDQQAATDLTAFTAQVAALPDTQIPPGCRADLLAVAAALQAQ
jgi:WD40 repeat protein